MLTLNDGRAELWQWDTGRTLDVDADCSQVHFSNKVFGRSIDVDVVDGAAIIPDILLQTDKALNVWAFVGTAENGYTKISKTFKVNWRNKPADYVFTPPDQMTLQTIQSQIGDLADLTTEAKDTLVAAINEAARTGGGAGSMDLRVADGYVQYSTDGGMTWTNLIAMAELKGADGITPTIGSNGNWYLGETDTGKPSRGETGSAGADGRDGADGQPGENGTDGYSPTANVTQTDSGATITITDKNGTTTATVTNGKDGADGNPGADGSPGKDGVDGKSAYKYAVDGGYTGTEAEFAAKLAEEMPTALPNPNALTFTGAVTGSYDGSAPVSVEIPSGGGSSGGSTAEWQLLGTYTMLVSDRTLDIDLSQFEGITHFRIIGNFPKCSEDCGSIYIYFGTKFNHIRDSGHQQNVYAFRLLAECELVDGQLYGFIGTANGWGYNIFASVVINTPRDSGKCTNLKIYYANAVNDTTENTIQIWGY